jgi:hypothetical protein
VAVGAHEHRVEGAEQLRDALVDRRTWSMVSSPRATPLWLETRPTGMPAARTRSSAWRAPGIARTRAGSPLYGTSNTSVPSRSKSTAAGGTGRGC